MHRKFRIFFVWLMMILLWSPVVRSQQSCTDSDNSSPNSLGVDRRTLGTTNGLNRITGRDQRSVDECWYGQLTEWYCDGNYVAGRTYNCPQGESCVGGVCTVPSGSGARNTACNSGRECQSGYCDSATHYCAYQPLGGACNDTSQCGEVNSISCYNYRCALNLGAYCDNHAQCISGYCGGEQYCSGGQGAPRVCRNICSLKPIGERCTSNGDCLSSICSLVPRDPSYGGATTGGEGPNCFAIVDIPPPPAAGLGAGQQVPQQPQEPNCIKICRAGEESIGHGERCSSHASFDNIINRKECISNNEVCRPWISQTTRQFYNISRKFCAAKIRSGDGCWYNAHCESGVCRDGRCQ